jgi:hypothetical protein
VKRSLIIHSTFWRDLQAGDRALMRDTIVALVEAGLSDVADGLCGRVFFSPSRRNLRFETLPDRFTDFVHLLLLELRWCASAPGWTSAMRRARAEEVLGLCGF